MECFQAQLTRSTVAEAANLAEIQRLASAAAEMQAELAFRPTHADIDDLTDVLGKLRQEVLAKDHQIERLQTSAQDTCMVDKQVATSDSLEDLSQTQQSPEDMDTGKISAEIDKMFRLDYDDDEDDESDSAATEINRDDDSGSAKLAQEPKVVRLDDEARLQLTMHNGSLHALEEELVRAKERWAEVCDERARLQMQLQQLQHKPRALSLLHVVVVVLPAVVACIYYILQPQLS